MVLLTNAYRISQANQVTPFEYTGILWTPLWGFLFFEQSSRVSASNKTMISRLDFAPLFCSDTGATELD